MFINVKPELKNVNPLVIPNICCTFAQKSNKTYMKIGIIIAMDKEFRRISELLDGQKREEDGGRIFVMGRLGDNELVLHQCGIGKVNAAVGVSELIRL